MKQAATLGITVCASSGDDGSAQGVNHPASSPNVLACGGTSLAAVIGGVVQSEVAWSSSGGGVTVIFPTTPPYQALAGVRRGDREERAGVPDVSGDADGHTGYDIVSSQIDMGMSGGTSASGRSGPP